MRRIRTKVSGFDLSKRKNGLFLSLFFIYFCLYFVVLYYSAHNCMLLVHSIELFCQIDDSPASPVIEVTCIFHTNSLDY